MEPTDRRSSREHAFPAGPAIGMALLLLLLPALAPAVQVQGLYQATVPVDGQGVEARNQATGAALEQVLVKLTGDRRIARRGEVAGLLQEAPKLLQQYRYQAAGGHEGQTDSRLLWVQFDSRSVNQAMHERGLPVWGENRPTLLLWLGMEQGGRRRFAGEEVDPGLTRALDGTAQARGMALLFPLLDLEDRSKVKAVDLWGGFDDGLREASTRYGADVILVGRLVRRGPESWRADWRMLDGDRSEEWQTRGTQEEVVADTGLEEAVDRLAGRYAPLGGAQISTGLVVSIDGVDDLDGFVQADRHLKSLDTVEQAVLIEVVSRRLLYRVQTRGGIDALARSLSLGGLLTAVPPPVAVGAAGAETAPDLGFRLNR